MSESSKPTWWHVAGWVVVEAALVGLASIAAIAAGVCENDCPEDPVSTVLVLLVLAIAPLGAAWWKTGKRLAGGSDSSEAAAVLVGKTLLASLLTWGPLLWFASPSLFTPERLSSELWSATEAAFIIGVGPAIGAVFVLATFAQVERVFRLSGKQFGWSARVPMWACALVVLALVAPELHEAKATYQRMSKQEEGAALEARRSQDPFYQFAQFSNAVAAAQTRRFNDTGELIDYDRKSEFDPLVNSWGGISNAFEYGAIVGSSSPDKRLARLQMSIGDSVFVMRFEVTGNNSDEPELVIKASCRGATLCGRIVPSGSHFVVADRRTGPSDCVGPTDPDSWCSSASRIP